MNHDHSAGGMGKHMLLMLICCLVPIALIVAVGTFGISLGPFQGLLPYLVALMCPLMMIFMMKGMMGGQTEDHSHPRVEAPRQLQPSTLLSEGKSGTVTTAVAPGQEKCD